MFNLAGLPPIKFKVVGDITEEEPVELDMATARIIMDRATRNLDELMTTAAESNPTPTEDTPKGNPAESKLSIEVSWDAEHDEIPEKTQELVVTLVGAGIIMALKDTLSDETLNERLAELARIRLEEDEGNRTALADAAEQLGAPPEEL